MDEKPVDMLVFKRDWDWITETKGDKTPTERLHQVIEYFKTRAMPLEQDLSTLMEFVRKNDGRVDCVPQMAWKEYSKRTGKTIDELKRIVGLRGERIPRS